MAGSVRPAQGMWNTAIATAWDDWQPSAPYSVGIEEEVMLLDPVRWQLAQRIEDVLPALAPELAEHVGAETHQAAIELATSPHMTVGAAISELTSLRGRLARALDGLGLAAAVAGTHPMAVWQDTLVSPSGRHQLIDRTMGELARREPTFALHVHVGVVDREDAIRLMNRLRTHLPLLLALSANSPFWQGRDTRLASARVPVFAAFPRTGIPRRYADYEDWRSTIDVLIRAGAFPEPTFLWWDIRLQPRYGTVEVRVMDAQTSPSETAALGALVQSLARLELEEGWTSEAAVAAHEVLLENHFLATRDGTEAALVDVRTATRRPVAAEVATLLPALRPHAGALGCGQELAGLEALMRRPGAARQRALAAGGIERIVPDLATRFAR